MPSAARRMMMKLAMDLAPAHEIAELNENIRLHDRRCPQYPLTLFFYQ